MTVYVDTMRATFGRMIMCHLFADTDDELHEAAQAVGVARKWFQKPPNASWRHYDICLSMRARAITRGAVVIEYRDLPKWVREHQPENGR